MYEFAQIEQWEQNVGEIGHGTMIEMSPEDAIFRAKGCEPITTPATDPLDPQGLISGMNVAVSSDLDGGEQPMEAEVVAANSDTIRVLRLDTEVGKIGVHFPRAGYRVDILD